MNIRTTRQAPIVSAAVTPSASTALLARIRASIASPNTKLLAPMEQEDIDDRRLDRALREKYAKWFVWILIGQLVAMNLVFLLQGVSFVVYDAITLRIYMGGTLAEVFGVVLVITRYLFYRKK